VVIHVVDIECIWIGKPKNNTPIRADGYSPQSLVFAFECVKPKSGKIHISNRPGSIESREDIAEFFGVLRHDATNIVVFIKTPQTLVPDRSNQLVP